METRTAKITIETGRSVADFADDPKDGWEPAAAYHPPERYFRTGLKEELRIAGIAVWQSRKFTLVPNSICFVEYDAANAGHASAIYQCEFEGPYSLIAKINQSLWGSDKALATALAPSQDGRLGEPS